MPSIPSHKPYRVGRSRTGLGLFATKPIKKGTRIIRYFGPLLDSKKKEEDAIENKYLFELNNRWTIDGSVRENVRLVAPKIREVHLRDLTDEAYPWRELFALLHDAGYEGFTLAEIPESPDPERMLRYFRALWLAYQPAERR